MSSALKAAQSSGFRRNTQSAQQLEEAKPMARPPSAGAQPGQQQQQAQQTPQQRQQQQQQVSHSFNFKDLYSNSLLPTINLRFYSIFEK